VITAGPDSNFGLAPEDLPEARRFAVRHQLRIVGLHQHIGSGLFDRAPFLEAMDRLLELVPTFEDLELVDIGGGFGVPYRPDETPIDLHAWGRDVSSRFARLERRLGRRLALLIEPGRYLVAECGVLLARVTTVKHTRDRVFVGLDSGMHHLVRPAMYGSYHPVYPLTPREGPLSRCFFVGPICESGDVLAEDRRMVAPAEGDLLAIGVAGAYGYAMASQYNLRGRPAEVLIDGTHARTIRTRERYRDVVRKRDL
jgi:diaminopimelate decarboxylase